MAGPLDHLIGRVVEVWADGLAEPVKKGTIRSREVRAGCSAGPLKVAVWLDEVLDSEVWSFEGHRNCDPYP